MKRRDFFKTTALASGSVLLPQFLKAFTHMPLPPDDWRLVIVQLSGGNDGLNTVVPYRNDDYYKLRPGISISPNEVLTLTDSLGLHPAMGDIRDLYHQGELCVLNNVGYPNPNRSHFRSMDIWHTASGADEYLQTGWLGRYLDAACAQGAPITTALEIDDTLSLALKGEFYKALAVQNPQKLHQAVHGLNIPTQSVADGNPLLHYLYKTYNETLNGTAYLSENTKKYSSSVEYPAHPLGQHLKLIGQLIRAQVHTRVFYAELGGFDTHIGQKATQQRLLSQYNQAISSFVTDLKDAGAWKKTMIMTFSEFGRRVQQNASGGTDHGTANNVFLMSGGLQKSGIWNENPNLQTLDDGDLIHSIDFRSVYNTLIERVLNVSGEKILGQKFDILPFV